MFIKCYFFNSFNRCKLLGYTVFNAVNRSELAFKVVIKQIFYNKR